MFHLNDLACFVTVYESGGFGRAADVLDSAQSQVSLRIRRLESNIGHKLFVRLHRSIHPTAKGEILYRHAKRVLKDVNELESALKGRSAA